jgi:hypothetical protein
MLLFYPAARKFMEVEPDDETRGAEGTAHQTESDFGKPIGSCLYSLRSGDARGAARLPGQIGGNHDFVNSSGNMLSLTFHLGQDSPVEFGLYRISIPSI